MPSSPNESQVLGNLTNQEIQLELPINDANTNSNPNFFKRFLTPIQSTATGFLFGSCFSGLIVLRDYLDSQSTDYQPIKSNAHYAVILTLPLLFGTLGSLMSCVLPNIPANESLSEDILEADDLPPSYESVMSQQQPHLQSSNISNNFQNGIVTSDATLIPHTEINVDNDFASLETPPPSYFDAVEKYQIGAADAQLIQ